MFQRLPSARRLLTGVTIVLVSAAVGLFGAALLHHTGHGSPLGADAVAPRAASSASFSARDARAARPLSGRRLIVRARHQRLPVYRAAKSHHITQVLHAREIDGQHVPIVMLAISHRPGWVHVRLPTRPNLGTGWVRRRDVDFAATSLRVEVQLVRHRMLLRDGSNLVLRAPIAVGRALSPTPTGHYFVTDIVKTPNPRGFYGPYSLGLSAYSPVYTSFAGGNGQVGLHGTNDPSKLGTDVSHGCIRLDNSTATRLAKTLPLGTPVDITR